MEGRLRPSGVEIIQGSISGRNSHGTSRRTSRSPPRRDDSAMRIDASLKTRQPSSALNSRLLARHINAPETRSLFLVDAQNVEINPSNRGNEAWLDTMARCAASADASDAVKRQVRQAESGPVVWCQNASSKPDAVGRAPARPALFINRCSGRSRARETPLRAATYRHRVPRSNGQLSLRGVGGGSEFPSTAARPSPATGRAMKHTRLCAPTPCR